MDATTEIPSPTYWTWLLRGLGLLLLTALGACGGTPAAAPLVPMVLERSIPLPGVAGRIDHLALDEAGGRLFVAALGQGAVEVVDLRAGRVVAELRGQAEPQGVAWLPDRQELWVASGDGRLGVYAGARLTRAALLTLGEDADNIRRDPRGGPVLVGYGDGALAMLDPVEREVIRTLALPGHPESFRLSGGRAYVNVPDAQRIAVVDLDSGAPLAAWPNGLARWNFPMALDPDQQVLAVVFRLPASLRLLDPASGATLLSAATCGDADDLFFDPPRRRLYVVCGSGAVDVFQASGRADYRRLGRIQTRAGARTGLFSQASDRLYIAARATQGQPAAILVFRPSS